MEEDDKMHAYQMTEKIQYVIEFYMNHSNKMLHRIIGKTLIATNLEIILIEKQLNQCKKRLKENIAFYNTDYGNNYPSIIIKNNIIGIQFHPEKSQINGFKLLSGLLEEESLG